MLLPLPSTTSIDMQDRNFKHAANSLVVYFEVIKPIRYLCTPKWPSVEKIDFHTTRCMRHEATLVNDEPRDIRTPLEL